MTSNTNRRIGHVMPDAPSQQSSASQGTTSEITLSNLTWGKDHFKHARKTGPVVLGYDALVRKIRVFGVRTMRLSPKQLTAFRRYQLGFVFEDANLLDTLTAFENIALEPTIRKTTASKIELLNKLGATLLTVMHDQVPSSHCGRIVFAEYGKLRRRHKRRGEEPEGVFSGIGAFASKLGATGLMHAKLAFGNIRRPIRDFGVCSVTTVLGTAVPYAFNSIADQEAIAFFGTAEKTVGLLGIL